MSLRKVAVVIVLIVIVGAGAYLLMGARANSMDAFAQCLAQKGATMYGAYWCPHCSEQKEKFGESFKYVHYVECGIPGQPPSAQTQPCKDMQIKKYPTWTFADGDRMEAPQSLQSLGQKTGCKVPESQ